MRYLFSVTSYFICFLFPCSTSIPLLPMEIFSILFLFIAPKFHRDCLGIVFFKVNFYIILITFFDRKSHVFFQPGHFPFKMYLMTSSPPFSLFFLSEIILSQILTCLVVDLLLPLPSYFSPLCFR